MSHHEDIFSRGKLQPGCLSQWQLHQLSLGLLNEAAGARCMAHAKACIACRTRHSAMLQERAQAQGAALPQKLLLELNRKPLWARFSTRAFAGTLAMAAAVLLMVTVQRQDTDGLPGTRDKGEKTFDVAILRDGKLMEGSTQSVGPLKAGDKVQIKAPARSHVTWQIVWMRDAGKDWEAIFSGEVKAGAFAPVALQVNGGAPTLVRVVVCDTMPAPPIAAGQVPAGCESHDMSF